MGIFRTFVEKRLLFSKLRTISNDLFVIFVNLKTLP